MARYPFNVRWWQRSRSWNISYTISGLIVLAIVIVLMFSRYPFGRDEVLTDAPVKTGVSQPITKLAVETEPRLDFSAAAQLPTSQVGPEVAELITAAVELIKADPSKVIEVREKLNDALLMPMDEQQRAFIKKQLSQLADRWLFSKTVYPDDKLCDIYKVRSGDQLRIIGERFKVPYEILMQINNISRAEALQAGEAIKVIKGPFHAKVYRSAFTMDLYLQNTYISSFQVGLGKPGMETPTGLWVVKPSGKLVKPVWADPLTGRTYRPEDPDYPLGSRWIALEGIDGQAKGRTGFAIHGTKNPEQIGMAGSQGCIRLHNGDAILMYNLLMPAFSRVEVVE